MRPILKFSLMIAGLYCAWIGMMAVHEFGHVVHAWVSGGSVSKVIVPVLGFSRTDLDNNPHPLFVAWGGAIWGCILPLAVWAVARWRRIRFWYGMQFFAGFCLIANGAYLAAGSFISAGDAGDLIRLGALRWTLIVFGCLTAPFGLYLWNGLGVHFNRLCRSAWLIE
jgi:hypothetical protein